MQPWGIVAWSKTLRDTEIGTVQGRAALTVNGIDVVGAALDVLDATGWPRICDRSDADRDMAARRH